MTATAGSDLRSRRRQQKLEAIVSEAWSLARRDGLAALSLRDLADRVELRQPSLYAYFGSKLELYDVMFADAYRDLLRRIETEPVSDDPVESLVALVRVGVQFSSDDIVQHQLLFQRTIPGFEPSPASYALALRFFQIAAHRLAQADVTETADIDLFTALVSGLAHQQVANEPGGDRWVRLAPRAVEMFLNDIRRSRGDQQGETT